jgi:amino acid transporter
MILTFLIQLTRDVLVSLPQLPEPSVNGYHIFYFCYLFVIGTTTGVFLLYFGYKVKKQLTQFKDVDKDRKHVIKKMNSLAIMSSIALILVTIVVVGFVIVLFVREENDDFNIASDLVIRAVEASYCLVVLGVYRRRVLAPNSSTSNHTKTPHSGATATVELKTDSSRQNLPAASS